MSHPDKEKIKELKTTFFHNVGTLEVPWRANQISLKDKAVRTDMYLLKKVFPEKIYPKGK
jgi:hypothetical protein